MKNRLFLAVVLVALLALMVVPALAQTTTVPPAYNWPNQGDTSQSGSLDVSFAKPDAWVAIVSNGVQASSAEGYPWTGELLGMSKLNADGSFTVAFSRPVQEGECLEFWYSPNGNGPDAPWEKWSTNNCVVPIPEPGTIYLMGTGILGLLGYAGLKLRSRRSK